jgi:hypothetical protein
MSKREFVEYLRGYIGDFERRNSSLKNDRVTELVKVMKGQVTWTDFINAFRECRKITRVMVVTPVLDFKFSL